MASKVTKQSLDVISSNFSSSLTKFRHLVRRCDFLALDLEFTGLHTTKRQNANNSDTHQVRYLKIKDSASNFEILTSTTESTAKYTAHVLDL